MFSLLISSKDAVESIENWVDDAREQENSSHNDDDQEGEPKLASSDVFGNNQFMFSSPGSSVNRSAVGGKMLSMFSYND